MMTAVVVAAALALQRRRQLIRADRTVAIGIELAEYIVGRGSIGATGAKRVFEFGFADLAIAIGIDLREQVLQGGRPAG
jgi:hypothetical protein